MHGEGAPILSWACLSRSFIEAPYNYLRSCLCQILSTMNGIILFWRLPWWFVATLSGKNRLIKPSVTWPLHGIKRTTLSSLAFGDYVRLHASLIDVISCLSYINKARIAGRWTLQVMFVSCRDGILKFFLGGWPQLTWLEHLTSTLTANPLISWYWEKKTVLTPIARYLGPILRMPSIGFGSAGWRLGATNWWKTWNAPHAFKIFLFRCRCECFNF